MSKVVKGIKKAFKWVAIAAAVYFTAGVALSYFGATSAFAASMPGFGAGGMFTKAATTIGLSGPATAAATAQAGSVAAGVSTAASAVPGFMGGGAGGSVAAMGSGAASGAATASLTASGMQAAKASMLGEQIGSKAATEAGIGAATQKAGMQVTSQTTGGASGGAGGGKTIQQAGQQVQQAGQVGSKMSTVDKLLIAKTVTGMASGLMDEEPEKPDFFGYSADGEGMDIIKNDPNRTVRPVTAPGDFWQQSQAKNNPGGRSNYDTGYGNTTGQQGAAGAGGNAPDPTQGPAPTNTNPDQEGG